MTDVRDVPVSWSWLKEFSRSAAHARYAALRPDNEPSLAMRLGAGTHAVAFGTPFHVYSEARRGKAWEAFREEHGSVPILNEREHALAVGMATALREHPDARRLLYGPGVEHEQPMEWTRYGRRCRTRGIDAINRGRWIVELKQARTVQPGRFERDTLRALYPCQPTWYDEGDALLTGRDFEHDPLEKYIIGVEPAPPHVVQVYRLSPSAVDFAKRTIGLYWSQLRDAEASDLWPGYSLSIVDFEAPGDAPPDDDDGAGPDDPEPANDAGPVLRWDGDGWNDATGTDP